ncbi:hypothetical protein K8I85_08265, partial [bacterium]|nr:hypothetical protein [bacterium]
MPLVRRPVAALFGLSLVCVLATTSPAAPLAPDDEGQAWLHRNLGIAYFANDAFADASRELSAAWSISGDDATDARNAGVAAL